MVAVDPPSPPDNSSTQPPPRSPRFKVRTVEDDHTSQGPPPTTRTLLSTPDMLQLQPVGRITAVVEHRLIASTPLSPPPRQLNYDPSPEPTPPVTKKVLLMSRSLDSVSADSLGVPTSPAQAPGSKPGGRLSRFQVKPVTTSTATASKAGSLTPLAEQLARAVTLDDDGTASAETLGSRRQVPPSPPLVHIVDATPRTSVVHFKTSSTALSHPQQGYFHAAGSIGNTKP